MTVAWTEEDKSLLAKLNKASWKRSFTPDANIDWEKDTTTREELLALYQAWSLLLGTGCDDHLDEDARVTFAAYQQMNLMLFTAMFERFALPNFSAMLRDDPEAAYQEYVAHLIKEETYHQMMFLRTIDKLREEHPELKKVPRKHIEMLMNLVMSTMRAMPSRWLRHGMSFFFLRFAEEVTLQANTIAKQAVPRADSLVAKVWELHAVDEARHVAFDTLMMKKARAPGPLAKVPAACVLPFCVIASVALNINDVWAARQVGAKVSYLDLPALMLKTKAPFKRRVFSLVKASLRRLDAYAPPPAEVAQ